MGHAPSSTSIRNRFLKNILFANDDKIVLIPIRRFVRSTFFNLTEHAILFPNWSDIPRHEVWNLKVKHIPVRNEKIQIVKWDAKNKHDVNQSFCFHDTAAFNVNILSGYIKISTSVKQMAEFFDNL